MQESSAPSGEWKALVEGDMPKFIAEVTAHPERWVGGTLRNELRSPPDSTPVTAIEYDKASEQVGVTGADFACVGHRDNLRGALLAKSGAFQLRCVEAGRHWIVFSLPTMMEIESSNLAAYGYIAELETLFVRFRKGGFYRYTGVPVGVADGMSVTSSVGSYFHEHIKKAGYPFRKIV